MTGKLAPGEKKLASSLDKQLANEFGTSLETGEVDFSRATCYIYTSAKAEPELFATGA
jgi:hypothetical protein